MARLGPTPQVVWMPGGVRTEVHATGADTDGALCLLVDEPPPGWSLPPHLHRTESETILVLEGSFEFEVAGERIQIGAGESLHVPCGIVHASANVGERAGRRVVLFSPAGIERFFLEVGSAEPGTAVEGDVLLAAAARHGWEFARPR